MILYPVPTILRDINSIVGHLNEQVIVATNSLNQLYPSITYHDIYCNQILQQPTGLYYGTNFGSIFNRCTKIDQQYQRFQIGSVRCDSISISSF